jgi:molybdopterin-guanine dinucleotide biosynthesis protein B
MKKPCIIQIVGYKNSGKTHLICRLVRELTALGYRVGTVKHDAHDFEIDREGRDTWQHQAAGAHYVAITSPVKTALIERQPVSLESLIARMSDADIILVEGFKSADYPKIVLLRSEEDTELLERVSRPVAAAAWFPWQHASLPALDIRDTDGILRLARQVLAKTQEEATE